MADKEYKYSQIDRVFRILEILSTGKKVCLKLMDFGVGLRTVQKDMVYIKNYLKDNLNYTDGCYSLLKKEYLDDFFKDNHKEIRNFFHAISLIDKNLFGNNFKKYTPLFDSIQAQQQGVYLFLENPFENLRQLNLKDRLEQYIQNKRYINIDYHPNELYKFKRVQPYKIIYQSGNWYLAVLSKEDYSVNSGFKLLRLNFIEKITLCKFPPYNFHDDITVKNFLDNRFQSLFTSYDKKFFMVKVHISKSVERHFKVKQYLKSQRVIEQRDDGLIVEFTINDEMEIIPLVQGWLPHIRILEPLSLNKRVLENIRRYESQSQSI